jgi:putative flippase GtrA
MRQLVSRHEKKLRFLIAGGINTLIGLSVYPALYFLTSPLGAGYIQVLLWAQIICITFSFVTNKYFVFKTKGNIKKEYAKFFAFYAIYFAINLIFLPIMVEGLGISPIIAQTIFSIAIVISSYFWHNFITFRKFKESIQ